MIAPDHCLFCSATRGLRTFSIAFGMGGDDFAFCAACLKSMTAEQFWRKLFARRKLKYPPQLVITEP
jgi:hypothetical protein